MKDNFKKHAMKSVMLVSAIFLLYTFLDALIGGILSKTKLADTSAAVDLIGSFSFACAGIALVMLVLMCVKYFSKKNKKAFDLAIFVSAIVSTVANIIFLVFTFCKYTLIELAATSDIPFFIYIVASIIIAVCSLMEYVDLSLEDGNAETENNEAAKKERVTKTKKNVFLTIVITIGVLWVTMASLFAGFAIPQSYTRYKDKISYLDQSIVETSNNNYNVYCYVTIYLRDIETKQKFEFKVNYTINGVEEERQISFNAIAKHPDKTVQKVHVSYKSFTFAEVSETPTVKINKVSYLKNGKYVELNEMQEVKYAVDTNERIFFYSGVVLAVIEIVMVTFLAVECEKTKVKDEQ